MPHIVSRKEVAALYRVQAQRVARWTEQGMPQHDDDQYDLSLVIKWHQDQATDQHQSEKARADSAEKSARSSEGQLTRARATIDRLHNEARELRLKQEAEIARLKREKDEAVRAEKLKALDREDKFKIKQKDLQEEIDDLRQDVKTAKETAVDGATIDLERAKLQLDIALKEEKLAKQQMERKVYERQYSRIEDVSLSVAEWCQRIRMLLMQLGDIIPALLPGEYKARAKHHIQRSVQTALDEMYDTKLEGIRVDEMIVLAAHLVKQKGQVNEEELLALLDGNETAMSVGGSDRFEPEKRQYNQHGRRKVKKEASSTPRKKKRAKKKGT